MTAAAAATRHLLQLLLLAAMAASPLSAKRSASHHHHHRNGGGGGGGGGHQFRGPLNVTAVSGVDVELRCRVRLQECGNFYSVVWYREEQPQATAAAAAAAAAEAATTPPPSMMLPSSASSSSSSLGTSQRVYVYRHNTGRGKSEGPWRGRVSHVYDAKRHVMRVSELLSLFFHRRLACPLLSPVFLPMKEEKKSVS